MFQHLRDLARRTEEDFMLMEREDADPLDEMEVCAVVIDNVRAMDALVAGAASPEKFATHMPCFVQSMVDQSQCIPLMQTILGLPEASFVDGLVSDLLSSVFMCALESPEVGSLCSMIKLILDRFTRTTGGAGGAQSDPIQSDRAKAIFCRHCTDPALVIVASALRLRLRMLVTLQKTLLDLLMAEEEGSVGGLVLHKVKASLLREMGIILWEQGASPSRAHFEDTAYQVVDTLETVIHERAHVWQRLQTEDHETLKLVCASLTALARIVLSHTSLLTRVDLMLKKMCHAKTCHKFVLNRANESLNLVQMPEILGAGLN